MRALAFRASSLQRGQLLQPQQRRVGGVRGRRLAPLLHRLPLRLHPHPDRLGLGLARSRTASASACAWMRPRVGLRLRVDPLHLGAGARLDQLGLAGPLGGQHLVHDVLQVPGEHQVLHVGPARSPRRSRPPRPVTSRRMSSLSRCAVGQDVLQRHRGQRPPGGELHVGVQPVLVARDRVDRRLRVGDRELHQDADADRHLVGGQDFLPLDGQVAGPHVHEVTSTCGVRPNSRGSRQLVPPGPEHLGEHAVLVPQPAVRVAG